MISQIYEMCYLHSTVHSHYYTYQIRLYHRSMLIWWYDLLCLTPLSEIFYLLHDGQLYWWKKLKYPQRATDHEQATGKLDHLLMQIECTFFVLCKAWCEPTPYWWYACMSCWVIQLPYSLSNRSFGQCLCFNDCNKKYELFVFQYIVFTVTNSVLGTGIGSKGYDLQNCSTRPGDSSRREDVKL